MVFYLLGYFFNKKLSVFLREYLVFSLDAVVFYSDKICSSA